jgi:hypothetical protein
MFVLFQSRWMCLLSFHCCKKMLTYWLKVEWEDCAVNWNDLHQSAEFRFSIKIHISSTATNVIPYTLKIHVSLKLSIRWSWMKASEVSCTAQQVTSQRELILDIVKWSRHFIFDWIMYKKIMAEFSINFVLSHFF